MSPTKACGREFREALVGVSESHVPSFERSSDAFEASLALELPPRDRIKATEVVRSLGKPIKATAFISLKD